MQSMHKPWVMLAWTCVADEELRNKGNGQQDIIIIFAREGPRSNLTGALIDGTIPSMLVR